MNPLSCLPPSTRPYLILGVTCLVISAVAAIFASQMPTLLGQALMAGCFAAPFALATFISFLKTYLKHEEFKEGLRRLAFNNIFN